MDSQDGYKSADRLQGMEKPRVWTLLTPLAQQLKAANLGQGFPTWKPAQFYIDYLRQQVDEGNHQYIRSFGSVELVNAIAKFHEKAYHPHKIDPLNDIVTTNGGSQALFCCFMSFVNPGDEVIFFDPAYDCYRNQIQMAGGKSIGLPLKPKKIQTKYQIKARIKQHGGVKSFDQDEWVIDFAQLQATLNSKTKVILINSPHNPVGKVFTQAQLARIADLLRKFPKVIIIEDNVYQGMIFDELIGNRLPKIIHEQGMYERTVSVYSAGKIFAATGVRSGWAIGSSKLIKSVRTVHTYNVFCYYGIIQAAIAKSLLKIADPADKYMVQYPKKLENLRNLLVQQLLQSNMDFTFWIPKGSNFIIVDVSKCKVKEKYLFDNEGVKRTHDYAFSLQLLYENGVSVIPCSSFYDVNNQADREKYVRLTFCKDEEIIRRAGKGIKQPVSQSTKQ